jgi:hypothetical protein
MRLHSLKTLSEAAAVLLLLTACSGKSASPTSGASGAGGSGGSAGGNDNDSAGAGPAPGSKDVCFGGCEDHVPRPEPLPRPQCPELEPESGESCSTQGLVCSYGDAPVAQCRHAYTCDAGGWALDTSPMSFRPCLALPEGYCPAAPAPMQACTVATPGIPCTYDALSCLCMARDPYPGAPGTWACYGPPENVACPATLPNLGEGCESNGTACDYAFDGCTADPNSSLFCYEGAWEQGEGYNCAL